MLRVFAAFAKRAIPSKHSFPPLMENVEPCLFPGSSARYKQNTVFLNVLHNLVRPGNAFTVFPFGDGKVGKIATEVEGRLSFGLFWFWVTCRYQNRVPMIDFHQYFKNGGTTLELVLKLSDWGNSRQ